MNSREALAQFRDGKISTPSVVRRTREARRMLSQMAEFFEGLEELALAVKTAPGNGSYKQQAQELASLILDTFSDLEEEMRHGAG